MSATSVGVSPSDECLQGEGLVWLVAAVVFASCTVGSNCPVNADNGWPHTALALADQLPLPRL